MPSLALTPTAFSLVLRAAAVAWASLWREALGSTVLDVECQGRDRSCWIRRCSSDSSFEGHHHP